MTAKVNSNTFVPKEYSPSVYAPQVEADVKTASTFEAAMELLHSLNEYSGIATTGATWGARAASTTDLSNKALNGVASFDMPLTGGLVIADLYDLQKLAASQTPDPLRLSKLCLSLISRVSGFVQMVGKTPLTESAMKRLSLIGLVSYLLKEMAGLALELKNFSSYTKILNCAVDLSVTLISLYLVFAASEALLMLQLTLSTASIGLSLLT
jgi:hypothetical protein